MQVINSTFNDFDVYNETVKSWKLVYNILSKKDFNAKLFMFTDDDFALSRITLQGKLVHSGKAPIGFRSVVVPINYDDKFIWYNKGTGGNELLIFNKNCDLDVITFNNFDAYVVSIENNLLENFIEENDLKNCKIRFGKSETELLLTKDFSHRFYLLADQFLNHYIKDKHFKITDQKKHTTIIRSIIFELLSYIDKAPLKKGISAKNKKEIALSEAIKIIENDSENLFSVKELALLTNISERSLLSAFKEKFQVTPSEYIKASRLNKVKNELYSLKNKGESIASIAGKYQFWHMGQFAKDFKKQFGMLPSDVKKEK